MSIDPSLKIKGALTRHRNVLTRAERLEKLQDEQKWTEQQSVFGLPKVAHRKSHAGKKAAEDKAAVEGAAAAEGTAAAPAAGAPAGAAAAKKASPAAKAAAKPAKPAK